MQNPNEDTEWNDVLRQKGIIPAKSKEKEFTEDDIVNFVEAAAQKHLNKQGKLVLIFCLKIQFANSSSSDFTASPVSFSRICCFFSQRLR